MGDTGGQIASGVKVARGDVLLWSVGFETIDTHLLTVFRQSLWDEERARADQFRFERDHVLYVTAHALLHAMLGVYAETGFRLRTNEWGKPEIDAPGNSLRFNLTHTNGLAACAVTMIDDLGVDAEARGRVTDYLELAGRFFAPSEAAYIGALTDADRQSAFLQLWTLKEAFIKAVGKGLSIPLDEFAFTLQPLSLSHRDDHEASQWRFESLTLSSGHHLAVALRQSRGGPMRHSVLSPLELAALVSRARQWEVPTAIPTPTRPIGIDGACGTGRDDGLR
jgi:4'-phosphopantetheinyl transferase